MVDVHRRVAAAPLGYEVDELFESALLSRAIERPKATKARIVVGEPASEKILEAAARLEERVAFHIEEGVARSGLRKQREAERRRVPISS